jgi:hypothetical protein
MSQLPTLQGCILSRGSGRYIRRAGAGGGGGDEGTSDSNALVHHHRVTCQMQVRDEEVLATSIRLRTIFFNPLGVRIYMPGAEKPPGWMNCLYLDASSGTQHTHEVRWGTHPRTTHATSAIALDDSVSVGHGIHKLYHLLIGLRRTQDLAGLETRFLEDQVSHKFP